jgi:hypothetical protein
LHRNKDDFISFKELLHSILKVHLEDCRMFADLTEKGFRELEKEELEFHYKLALKTLMKVRITYYTDWRLLTVFCIENSSNERGNQAPKQFAEPASLSQFAPSSKSQAEKLEIQG